MHQRVGVGTFLFVFDECDFCGQSLLLERRLYVLSVLSPSHMYSWFSQGKCHMQ